MGFCDENGYSLINDQHKIRFMLSGAAQAVMREDMQIFGISEPSSFINKVFENFKYGAKASAAHYLTGRKLELERLFNSSDMDGEAKNAAAALLLGEEKKELLKRIGSLKKLKGESSIYYINNDNVNYLNGCGEDEYYGVPGFYMRAVIEEYCSLPFIERLKIFRRDVFDIAESACAEGITLELKTDPASELSYIVYPYKIVPDSMQSQLYLTGYSLKPGLNESFKKPASFSMLRMRSLKRGKKLPLNKREKEHIENLLARHSPAYLLEEPSRIEVKLTPKGESLYKKRIHMRPEKIKGLSDGGVYVFECSEFQALYYFLPFAEEAEILSPLSLRKSFAEKHKNAARQYEELL